LAECFSLLVSEDLTDKLESGAFLVQWGLFAISVEDSTVAGLQTSFVQVNPVPGIKSVFVRECRVSARSNLTSFPNRQMSPHGRLFQQSSTAI
jgi:hypothetical protein